MPDPARPSITSVLRQFQQANGLVDPADVADKFLATVSSEQAMDLLAQALPYVARQACLEQRHRIRTTVPAPSAKVAAVRSWHARLLAQAVDVSGDGGQWKTLGECGAHDLRQLAVHRRKLAEQNIAAADRYSALVAAMRTAEAETVADLSTDVLRTIYGGTE